MGLDDELTAALRREADAVAVDGEAAWVRHRAAVDRSRRRRWVAGGAAAVAAAAAVVLGVVAVVGDGGGAGERLEVVPPAGETTTTAAPSTTTKATGATTATTATTATVAPAPFPATAVAATWDGRLVEIDTETGEVLRQIDDRYSDLDDPPPQEGTPWTVIQVVPVPEAGTVYVETCCEPAGGDIRAYGAVVGEPGIVDEEAARADRPVTNGYGPSLSPDGSRLAYGQYTLGIGVYDGPGQRIARGDDDAGRFYELTTWLGNERIAYVVAEHDGSASTRTQILVHDVAAGDLAGDRVVADLDERVVALVTRGDGSLVWFDAGGTAHVLDPATGDEIATFDVGAPVADAAYDASGAWLLVVTEDGDLRWFGGGRTGAVPGRYTAAGW